MVSVINMFVVSLLSLETSGEEAIRVDRSGRCTLKDARERERSYLVEVAQIVLGQ